MRFTRYIQASVLSLAVMVCANYGGDFDFTTSAEAKGYFTKKRVNGRWVHGRFSKNEAKRHQKQNREVDRDDDDAKKPISPARKEALAATPLLANASARPADISSITYDVKNRTESVTYVDGKVIVRPFDPERIPTDSLDAPTPAPPQLAGDEYERLRVALIKKAEALRTAQGPR